MGYNVLEEAYYVSQMRHTTVSTRHTVLRFIL